MAYQFKLPGRTVIGEDALKSCTDIIKGFGTKAFVVTGKKRYKIRHFKKADRLFGRMGYWLCGFLMTSPESRRIR